MKKKTQIMKLIWLILIKVLTVIISEFDKNQDNIGWQKNPLNPANQKNNDDKK
ncbi:hypothetical protein OGZ02_13355 [Brachyspira hyodysenteriae]|nr:hypothetical protein [Brachyspira hyodysenteriae]MDA1469795.1 hypothetical protein [Brachyspira hyodysenteriae]